MVFNRAHIAEHPLLFLAANGRGGMLRAPVRWGGADQAATMPLLAANRDPEIPEDRWIMLARCRAWVAFQGYSQGG